VHGTGEVLVALAPPALAAESDLHLEAHGARLSCTGNPERPTR
jgi:hypothetical protein